MFNTSPLLLPLLPPSVPAEEMRSSSASLPGGGVRDGCLPPEFTWDHTAAGHSQHTGASTLSPTLAWQFTLDSTRASVDQSTNQQTTVVKRGSCGFAVVLSADVVISVCFCVRVCLCLLVFAWQVVDGFFVKRVQDVRESAAYLTVMTRYLTKLYQVTRMHFLRF